MDPTRFDTLIRSLTRSRSRRGLLPLLGSSFGLAKLPSGEEAAARKRKKKKKVTLCHEGQTLTVGKRQKKKHLKHGDAVGDCQSPPPSPPPPGCTANCDRKICGDDGCGGSCGTCGAEQVCANGRCAAICPGGQKVCGGDCIPGNDCCSNADCVNGQECRNGACVCGADADCRSDEFCQRDVFQCMPCRGATGSCYAGGGIFGGGVCCSDLCVVDACRDRCTADGDCPSGKCCIQVTIPFLKYCAFNPNEPCQ